jgi:hypothetical protein
VVPQRSAGRVPSQAARIYELATARWTRIVARLGGTKGLFDGDSRRSRIVLGAHGERLAIRRLRRDGYRIIARNFRGAEVDVVAMDRDTLVFVEVKTRAGAEGRSLMLDIRLIRDAV